MHLDNNILYADMINSIALGANILYEDEGAILLEDIHSSIFYCAACLKTSGERMVEKLPSSFGILVSHDELSNQILLEKRGLRYENRCYHCAYLKKDPLPISLKEGYEIKKVTPLYMHDVIRLYEKEMPELANEEYMGVCMESGMYGVFDGNVMCGFISVHEGGYGSIGMLEIDEAYRRNGFGVALERYMINVQLERNRIPYGEIFVENEASIYLQARAGMEIGKDLTYWFYQ